MLDTLRRLLRRLLGRGDQPPCHPEPEQAQPGRDNPHLDQSQRLEEQPAEDWVERINRPPEGGDWFQERLRSLPDEEKRQKQERHKHRSSR